MEGFVLAASDGHEVHCYKWLVGDPKGVIYIAHGMGEHAKRYGGVAEALNRAGYSVYANDHRGHGETGRELLGYFGPDGWNRILADSYEIIRYIQNENPGKKRALLGHSMGSMLAQQFITRYAASIDMLVLSGSPGFAPASAGVLPKLLAQFESWRLGPSIRSPIMQNLLFGGSNKPFDGPQATGFEWLSRDADEVQKYVVDELCGFVVSSGSLIDLFDGAKLARNSSLLDRIPERLPIYIFSGADDPVHSEQKNLNRMVGAYRARCKNVTYRLYAEGRHEMFNEINRDEVVAELIRWLDTTTANL